MLSRLRPKYVWLFDRTVDTDEATGADLASTWGGALRSGAYKVIWDRKPSPRHRRDEAHLSLEWNILSKTGRELGVGASLQASVDDYDWTASLLAGRVANLFVSLGGVIPPAPSTRESPYTPRVIELTYAKGTIHWRVWADAHEWSSSTPRWKDGHFEVTDWLFGKVVHTKVELATHQDVPIPLPEGQYLATVTMTHETWRRPRTILGIGNQDRIKAHIEFPVPIPTGPKGPTSALTTPIDRADLWRAVAATTEMVLRNRNRGSGRGDRLLPR